MAPPGFPAFSHAPALTLAPAAKFLVQVTQCPYHVAVDRGTDTPSLPAISA